MYTMFYCFGVLSRALRMTVAMGMAIGLCHVQPVWAQLGLPHVTAPTVQPTVPPTVPTTVPPKLLPNLQPAPQVLPGQQFPNITLPVQSPRPPPAPSMLQLPSVTPVQQTLGVAAPITLPTLPSGQQASPLTTVTDVTTSLSDATVSVATVAQQGNSTVPSVRAAAARALLRKHADVLEADPRGDVVRRQELLWVSPQAPHLDAALTLGFVVLREQTLETLGLRQVVLHPPKGWSTAQALDALRALDPQVVADFNHIYQQGGRTRGKTSAVAQKTNSAVRVGLVDGGLDTQHPALREADVHRWGCGGRPFPSQHGTAVASLLVGRGATLNPVAPGAVLYAADIYCGQAAGGAAEEVASALEWLAREKLAVINISLVGPPNRLLEQVVQSMVRSGHLLVAAVGNDGPAAPPLYPAAYPGVVGVTAVNRHRQALPEAAQGPQVMFAALGADVAVAEPGARYGRARGTSFAAPVVAGLLAQALDAPDQIAAQAALAQLAERAVDLGAPGRDPVFGLGLVGPMADAEPGSAKRH